MGLDGFVTKLALLLPLTKGLLEGFGNNGEAAMLVNSLSDDNERSALLILHYRRCCCQLRIAIMTSRCNYHSTHPNLSPR